MNLGAFYPIELPLGFVFFFINHLQARGFRIGIVPGTAAQPALLALTIAFTDWRNRVKSKENCLPCAYTHAGLIEAKYTDLSDQSTPPLLGLTYRRSRQRTEMDKQQD